MKIKVAIAALVCAVGLFRVAATSGGDKYGAPRDSAPPQITSKGTQPKQKVGTVIALEGSVSVILAGAIAPSPLNVNDPVSVGDSILTGGQSEAYVLFADNTEFHLADDTNFVVVEYVYDPKNPRGNKASFGIIEGMFKYVGGSIGKSRDARVSIDTPVGAIGTHGTEFIVESDGTPDNLQIALISGSIALTPTGGSEESALIAGPTMNAPLEILVTRDGSQSQPMTQAQYDSLLVQYFPVAPTP